MIEWKTLTPEQRNALVAEQVMGWQERACDGKWEYEMPLGYGNQKGMYVCKRCHAMVPYYAERKHDRALPPRYSESIESALVLAETFASSFKLYHTRDRWYLCEIFDATYKSHLGTSKNAAEAICIAALRFRGIEVSDE